MGEKERDRDECTQNECTVLTELTPPPSLTIFSLSHSLTVKALKNRNIACLIQQLSWLRQEEVLFFLAVLSSNPNQVKYLLKLIDLIGGKSQLQLDNSIERFSQLQVVWGKIKATTWQFDWKIFIATLDKNESQLGD